MSVLIMKMDEVVRNCNPDSVEALERIGDHGHETRDEFDDSTMSIVSVNGGHALNLPNLDFTHDILYVSQLFFLIFFCQLVSYFQEPNFE